MKKIEVKKGQVFGYWVATGNEEKRYTPKGQSSRYIECICRCGVKKYIRFRSLQVGISKSCGCLQLDTITSHGLSYSNIYATWKRIKRRCNSISDPYYKDYGGRGITYDPHWEKFEHFYEDMKDGYRSDLSIDRIDVNGNYCKENCRWTTMKIQASNKRNTIRIKLADGSQTSLRQFCREYNINYNTLYYHFSKGNITIEEIERKFNKSF